MASPQQLLDVSFFAWFCICHINWWPDCWNVKQHERAITWDDCVSDAACENNILACTVQVSLPPRMKYVTVKEFNLPSHAPFVTYTRLERLTHLLLMSKCFDPLWPCPLCPLRTNQEQPESDLPRGRWARKPQTGLTKWDGPLKRGRQRQPHRPSEAHVRGSPRLPRDPGYAAVGHGQEEGSLPGTFEAEIPPSCISNHGSPGEAAGAGQ